MRWLDYYGMPPRRGFCFFHCLLPGFFSILLLESFSRSCHHVSSNVFSFVSQVCFHVSFICHSASVSQTYTTFLGVNRFATLCFDPCATTPIDSGPRNLFIQLPSNKSSHLIYGCFGTCGIHEPLPPGPTRALLCFQAAQAAHDSRQDLSYGEVVGHGNQTCPHTSLSLALVHDIYIYIHIQVSMKHMYWYMFNLLYICNAHVENM